MKLKKLILKNFKAYKEAEIDFDSISVIVGKNDAGKSSLLHALDLFFNNGAESGYKISDDTFFDNTNEIRIECVFEVCKDIKVIIDSTEEITINDISIFNKDGYLSLIKIWKKNDQGKYETSVMANVMNWDLNYISTQSTIKLDKCDIIEDIKQKQLQDIIKKLNITSENDKINQKMREVIIQYLENNGQALIEKTIEIDDWNVKKKSTDDGKGAIKTIMMNYAPKFQLFGNEKNSTNQATSSLQEHIKSRIITDDIRQKIDDINQLVKEQVDKLMKGTTSEFNQLFGQYDKGLEEKELKCDIEDGISEKTFKPTPKDSNGRDVEYHRGAGFKRLMLFSLFIADAKLKHNDSANVKNVIYAMEEPETFQNPYNQRAIVQAINQLSINGSQVIVTTHSPSLAKEFSGDNIEYIIVENDKNKSSIKIFDSHNVRLQYVVNLLGILPLDLIGKKLIVFVEGLDEQILLKKINDDIFKDDEILFISGGGNSIHFHIACNYFNNKLKLMSIVDKGYDGKKVKEELSKIYPSSKEADYFIETKKEDITLYYIISPEQNFYNSDGSYNKQRKGDVSNVIKNDILQNNLTLNKTNFHDWSEIESWFEQFKAWKKRVNNLKAEEENDVFNVDTKCEKNVVLIEQTI